MSISSPASTPARRKLFHTLAALTQDGRRVVFTAGPAAHGPERDGCAAALTSARPAWSAGIEPADRALRLGILERKLDQLSHQQGLTAAARPEVLQFLADRFTESVRETRGSAEHPGRQRRRPVLQV